MSIYQVPILTAWRTIWTVNCNH